MKPDNNGMDFGKNFDKTQRTAYMGKCTKLSGRGWPEVGPAGRWSVASRWDGAVRTTLGVAVPCCLFLCSLPLIPSQPDSFSTHWLPPVDEGRKPEGWASWRVGSAAWSAVTQESDSVRKVLQKLSGTWRFFRSLMELFHVFGVLIWYLSLILFLVLAIHWDNSTCSLKKCQQ